MSRIVNVILACVLVALPLVAGAQTFEIADDAIVQRDSISIEPGDDVYSSLVTVDPIGNEVIMLRNQAIDRYLEVQVVGQTDDGAAVLGRLVRLEPAQAVDIPTGTARYVHLLSTGPFTAGLVRGHELEMRMIDTQVMAYQPSAAKICVDPTVPGGICPPWPPIIPPIIVCDAYWTLWCATTDLCGSYSKGADGYIDISSGSHRIYWAEHQPIGSWITIAMLNGEGCVTYWTPDESGVCPIYASASCNGEGYHVSI